VFCQKNYTAQAQVNATAPSNRGSALAEPVRRLPKTASGFPQGTCNQHPVKGGVNTFQIFTVFLENVKRISGFFRKNGKKTKTGKS